MNKNQKRREQKRGAAAPQARPATPTAAPNRPAATAAQPAGNRLQTRGQRWATTALACVQNAARVSATRAEYKALVMKLPVLLRQSGIVQGLVFVRSRGELGETILNDLASVYGARSGDVLLGGARDEQLPGYLALSRDLIDAATWLRRFAQIELA